MTKRIKIHTGGAVGSDNVFATQGSNHGAEIIVHSFKEHDVCLRGIDQDNLNLVVHTREELDEAFGNYVVPVAQQLGRNVQNREYPSYITDLLSRDYFQVKDVEAVFAVVQKIDEILPFIKVPGGTAYAISMATMIGVPKLYIFDQSMKEWRYFVKDRTESGVTYYQAGVTTQESLNIYNFNSIAGIGTRNLSIDGLRAIKELFK